MMKFKLIGTAIALSLATGSLAAGAGCCAAMACCKDGADCCKGKDDKSGCCDHDKAGSSGDMHDMPGMKH